MPGSFAARIVAWQGVSGRHSLPWQGTRDPYLIWLSEIMLQQTQVATVVPYFERFVSRFPDLATLATAAEEDVLRLWSGLGYYARARNLHACARVLLDRHGGRFPTNPDALAGLPGVGRSTAAAIAVFAYGERAAILDGNVRRVLCRYFEVDTDPSSAATTRELWRIAERELADTRVEAYTQGLMDLGATVCTRARARCGQCPLREGCAAHRNGRVGDLPARAARARTPLRVRAMLVLHASGAVLCERQPSPGIWGGLWSPPWLEFELNDAPLDARSREALRESAVAASASRGLRAAASSVEIGAPIEHAFTHFRLRAHPVLVRLASSLPSCREPGTQRWIALAAFEGEALPKPVTRLFETLRDGD